MHRRETMTTIFYEKFDSQNLIYVYLCTKLLLAEVYALKGHLDASLQERQHLMHNTEFSNYLA